MVIAAHLAGSPTLGETSYGSDTVEGTVDVVLKTPTGVSVDRPR
jgi:hypothetical protein